MCKFIFYAIISDYFEIVCKLVEKLYDSKKRCLVLSSTPEETDLLDNKLWTYSKMSFIPHGSIRSRSPDEAKYCYVWISEEECFINNPTVLIHRNMMLSNYGSYENIINIFNVSDIAQVEQQYKNIKEYTLWMQDGSSWRSTTFDTIS